MIVRAALAACLLASAPAGAGAARPSVSLIASPSHVALAGAARQVVRVRNSGREAVVVDVSRAGFALDLRGRPRIVSGGGRAWLTVKPHRLSIRPGGTAALLVSSKPPVRAEPGDHGALVLLTTRPRRSGGLAVRMRLGVVVAMRVPGKIVRRLEVRRLRVRRSGRARMIELLVANRGNVTETLSRGCLTVAFRRGGRVLARLHPVPRQLLPRTTGLVEVRYGGRARGWVKAQVALSAREPCGKGRGRAFRVRL